MREGERGGDGGGVAVSHHEGLLLVEPRRRDIWCGGVARCVSERGDVRGGTRSGEVRCDHGMGYTLRVLHVYSQIPSELDVRCERRWVRSGTAWAMWTVRSVQARCVISGVIARRVCRGDGRWRMRMSIGQCFAGSMRWWTGELGCEPGRWSEGVETRKNGEGTKREDDVEFDESESRYGNYSRKAKANLIQFLPLEVGAGIRVVVAGWWVGLVGSFEVGLVDGFCEMIAILLGRSGQVERPLESRGFNDGLERVVGCVHGKWLDERGFWGEGREAGGGVGGSRKEEMVAETGVVGGGGQLGVGWERNVGSGDRGVDVGGLEGGIKLSVSFSEELKEQLPDEAGKKSVKPKYSENFISEKSSSISEIE
ncbi:hypothetical protein Tco_1404630 [Tanacetum coccineum]